MEPMRQMQRVPKKRIPQNTNPSQKCMGYGGNEQTCKRKTRNQAKRICEFGCHFHRPMQQLVLCNGHANQFCFYRCVYCEQKVKKIHKGIFLAFFGNYSDAYCKECFKKNDATKDAKIYTWLNKPCIFCKKRFSGFVLQGTPRGHPKCVALSQKGFEHKHCEFANLGRKIMKYKRLCNKTKWIFNGAQIWWCDDHKKMESFYKNPKFELKICTFNEFQKDLLGRDPLNLCPSIGWKNKKSVFWCNYHKKHSREHKSRERMRKDGHRWLKCAYTFRMCGVRGWTQGNRYLCKTHSKYVCVLQNPQTQEKCENLTKNSQDVLCPKHVGMYGSASQYIDNLQKKLIGFYAKE